VYSQNPIGTKATRIEGFATVVVNYHSIKRLGGPIVFHAHEQLSR